MGNRKRRQKAQRRSKISADRRFRLHLAKQPPPPPIRPAEYRGKRKRPLTPHQISELRMKVHLRTLYGGETLTDGASPYRE